MNIIYPAVLAIMAFCIIACLIYAALGQRFTDKIVAANLVCTFTVNIICVLAAKEVLRYSALRKEMRNITDAVLAAALKELIGNQIVARQSYDEIPPRVEYSLTEKGQSVVPILQSICQWSGIYHKKDYSNTMTQCEKCDYRGGTTQGT